MFPQKEARLSGVVKRRVGFPCGLGEVFLMPGSSCCLLLRYNGAEVVGPLSSAPCRRSFCDFPSAR